MSARAFNIMRSDHNGLQPRHHEGLEPVHLQPEPVSGLEPVTGEHLQQKQQELQRKLSDPRSTPSQTSPLSPHKNYFHEAFSPTKSYASVYNQKSNLSAYQEEPEEKTLLGMRPVTFWLALLNVVLTIGIVVVGIILGVVARNQNTCSASSPS